MTHAMRMELANLVRCRYAAAANKDKRRILEEFIAATGYHEKSAIRVLNSPPGRKSRWQSALKNVRIRPHLNFSWSSKPVAGDNTACDSFTRC